MGRHVAGAGCHDLRQVAKALQRGDRELLGPRRVTSLRDLDVGDQHVGGVESGIDTQEVHETAREERAPHEQDDGQGDLDHHERLSQPSTGIAHAAEAADLHRADEVDAGLPQRGENRRDRTDEDRDDAARGQEPHIDSNVLETRKVLGSQRSNRGDEHPPREQAQDSADQRKHDALGNDLLQQAAAPRTERRASREFACSSAHAREQQVGDVGAGDRQDQPRAGEEEQERRAHARGHLFDHRTDPNLHRRPFSEHQVGERTTDAPCMGRPLHLGLNRGRRIGQPRDGPDDSHHPGFRIGLGHLERHMESDLVPALRSRHGPRKREARRQDADDPMVDAIEGQSPVDDLRVAAEAFLPRGVSQDHDRGGAAFRVGVIEEAAGDGRRPQHAKQRRRDLYASDAPSGARAGHVELAGGVAADRFQAIGRSGPGAVRRGAEHGLPERRVRAGMHLPQPDQAPGFVVGERTQQHAMDDREDGGRAPDAEGHREQGRGGEPAVREQNAKRQADVLNEETHSVGSYHHTGSKPRAGGTSPAHRAGDVGLRPHTSAPRGRYRWSAGSVVPKGRAR